jgi:hypothetical protein
LASNPILSLRAPISYCVLLLTGLGTDIVLLAFFCLINLTLEFWKCSFTLDEEVGEGRKGEEEPGRRLCILISRLVITCQRNKISSEYHSFCKSKFKNSRYEKSRGSNFGLTKNLLCIIRYRDNSVKYFLYRRDSITACAFSQRFYFANAKPSPRSW